MSNEENPFLIEKALLAQDKKDGNALRRLRQELPAGWTLGIEWDDGWWVGVYDDVEPDNEFGIMWYQSGRKGEHDTLAAAAIACLTARYALDD